MTTEEEALLQQILASLQQVSVALVQMAQILQIVEQRTRENAKSPIITLNS